MEEESHSRSSSASSTKSKRGRSPETSPSKSSLSLKKPKKQNEMTEIANLTKMISELTATANETKRLVEGCKAEVEAHTVTLNDIDRTMVGLQRDLTTVTQRVDGVDDKVLEMRRDIVQSQNESDALRADLNRVEQTMLAAAFNIFGLPSMDRKKAYDVFKDICVALKFEVDRGDLSELYVVNHKNAKESHICGRFHDERKKIELMRLLKAEKASDSPILTEDIFTAIEADHPRRGKEINIRTRLTETTQKLLNYALQYWDKYKFIWESDGRVMVRATESARPTEIRSQQQLTNLHGLPTTQGQKRPKPKVPPPKTNRVLRTRDTSKATSAQQHQLN